MMQVNFQFEYETKGAVRFAEVDARGNKIDDIKNAKVGTIYIRKNALPRIPAKLSVVIDIDN